MIERMKGLLRDEEGATMVEYALVVAAIATVALVGATTLGGQLSTKFAAIGNTVATP